MTKIIKKEIKKSNKGRDYTECPIGLNTPDDCKYCKHGCMANDYEYICNYNKSTNIKNNIKDILEKHNYYSLDLEIDLKNFLSIHDKIMYLKIDKNISSEIYLKYKKVLDEVYTKMAMNREQRRQFHYLLSEFAKVCGKK